MIVDEASRECLDLHGARSIRAEDVIARLEPLMAERGAPKFVRSDNGPEFLAKAVVSWMESHGIRTLFIEPGSPWENAYVESFNGKLRDELLAGELITSYAEARYLLGRYLVEYNEERPHSSLGMATPAEHAARCSLAGMAGRNPRGSSELVLVEESLT